MGSTLTNKLYIFEIPSVLFYAGCTVALSTTYQLPKEGFIKEYAKGSARTVRDAPSCGPIMACEVTQLFMLMFII